VIADDSGIPQDIFTESYRLVSGKVTINHVGNLRVGEIRTRSIGQQTTDGRGEEVTLIGNGNGQAATGDCSVNTIMAYFGRTTYGAAVRSGPVTITGYKNVTVGDIKTYNASGASSSRSAGHIFITNIVDTITITGELDAEQRAFPASSGMIELATLNGDIVVTELDLQKMLYITFDAGSSISRINGELANFDGTVEEPGTRLRASAGQRIYYRPDDNPDLDGLTYPLVAPDGVSAGGVLKPEPALGTLLLIK
jgi:hypothetical protein